MFIKSIWEKLFSTKPLPKNGKDYQRDNRTTFTVLRPRKWKGMRFVATRCLFTILDSDHNSNFSYSYEVIENPKNCKCDPQSKFGLYVGDILLNEILEK
jgi:hypothetical protein